MAPSSEVAEQQKSAEGDAAAACCSLASDDDSNDASISLLQLTSPVRDDDEEEDNLSLPSTSIASHWNTTVDSTTTERSNLPLDHANKVVQRQQRRHTQTALDGPDHHHNNHHQRSKFSQDMKELSMGVTEAIRQLHHQQQQDDGMPPARLRKITKKGVSFSTIQIFEHPMIVGDNPGGVRGCPVSIGWESVAEFSLELNDYERVRDEHRRDMQQMRMTAAHREHILRGLGFSRQEILGGTKTANLIRHKRRVRNEMIHLDKFNERVESLQRMLRNVLPLGKKKRRDQQVLIQKYYVSKDVLDASRHGTSRRSHHDDGGIEDSSSSCCCSSKLETSTASIASLTPTNLTSASSLETSSLSLQGTTSLGTISTIL